MAVNRTIGHRNQLLCDHEADLFSMCVVGILTRDIGKALEFSQKVQAGSVWINCYDHTVCQVSLLDFRWVSEMVLLREKMKDVFKVMHRLSATGCLFVRFAPILLNAHVQVTTYYCYR